MIYIYHDTVKDNSFNCQLVLVFVQFNDFLPFLMTLYIIHAQKLKEAVIDSYDIE